MLRQVPVPAGWHQHCSIAGISNNLNSNVFFEVLKLIESEATTATVKPEPNSGSFHVYKFQNTLKLCFLKWIKAIKHNDFLCTISKPLLNSIRRH